MTDAVRREILPGGARVLVAKRDEACSVALGLWVGSGADDDPDGLSGLAHLLEHMLVRGGSAAGRASAVRGAAQGRGFAAETGRDYTVFHRVVPREVWRAAMAAHARVLLARSFKAADVRAEREIVRDEAAGEDGDPWAFVSRRVMEALFPSRRPVVGTSRGISRICEPHLIAFQRSHYVAANVVQVVVGDVCEDDALEAARPLGDLPRTAPPPRRRVCASEGGGASRRFRRALSLEYVGVGYALPAAFHADIAAIDAVVHLLEAGHASLIGRRMRESVASAACTSATLVPGRDRSFLAVQAAAPPGGGRVLAERLVTDLGGLALRPPARRELETLARRAEAARILGPRTVERAAMRLGAHEVLGGGWSGRPLAEGRTVSAEDIARIAERYLRPEMAAVVTCGRVS